MSEPRFNLGDEVFYASIRGGKFGVIKAINHPPMGWAMVDFDGRAVLVSMECDLYLASEVDRRALPKSEYEKRLDAHSAIFQPGATIMNCQFGYGTVVEVNPNGTACVDFKCDGHRFVETRSFNSWRAEEKDKDWRPREPEPEPSCKSEEATLVNLLEILDRWEEIPRHIQSGVDDDEDEYRLDLSYREELHGVLNGLADLGVAVTNDIKERIETADRQFVDLTCEREQHVWGGSTIYDKEIFWYYFRWLRA